MDEKIKEAYSQPINGTKYRFFHVMFTTEEKPEDFIFRVYQFKIDRIPEHLHTFTGFLEPDKEEFMFRCFKCQIETVYGVKDVIIKTILLNDFIERTMEPAKK